MASTHIISIRDRKKNHSGTDRPMALWFVDDGENVLGDMGCRPQLVFPRQRNFQCYGGRATILNLASGRTDSSRHEFEGHLESLA